MVGSAVRRRRGVAATLVSVIFFTILLLANAALSSAWNSYLSSSVLTSAQQRELEYAPVLVGLSSFTSLSAAEEYLESHPLQCSSTSVPSPLPPPPSSPLAGNASRYDYNLDELQSMAGSEHVSGSEQGIEYRLSTTWRYAASGPSGDNLTVMSSFDGFSSGDVNLLVTSLVNETLLGGLPSYQTQQEHVLHLPIDPEALASVCLSTLALLREFLSSPSSSSSLSSSCTSSSLQSALDSLRSTHAYLESAELGGSAQASAGGGSCTVSFWFSFTQTYEGVSGTSGWSAVGAQTFSI